VRDPRVDFVTFTGSSRVGADIKAASGLRRAALELGGNGPSIVCEDASIEEAAPLCARNAMRLAGQSCISVQSVYVHRSLYQAFVARVVAEVQMLKTGDPLDLSTEVFGPVVSILPYDDFDAVCAAISASRFGLQCGVFTKSMPTALKAIRSIRTGGVIINGSSTWRTDQLPYGGVKDSGTGREGPRYAIRDMTEERLVVFNA
jgi:acyl-CoA reductase-like NAD-dependent aldehyde dehydrogenase